MADIEDVLGDSADTASEAAAPRPKAPPIESRFLFVDVAAMRAKQLRRGAIPRLSDDNANTDTDHRVQPFKAERVAMEEVKRCLVLYEVPDGDHA
jgi:DNA-directed RNA polymerase subunit K/omega